MNLRVGAVKKITEYFLTLSWIMSYQHWTAELHDSLWNWFYHMVPQCILWGFFSYFPCIFNALPDLWVQIPFPSANSNFLNTWAVSNTRYLIFISLVEKYFSHLHVDIFLLKLYTSEVHCSISKHEELKG